MTGHELGQLARQRLLDEPDDWTEGWFWTWVGRRSAVEKDKLSGNWAGHILLQTTDNRLVSFEAGHYHADSGSKVLPAVLKAAGADHTILQSFCSTGNLTEKDTQAGYALQAEGIEILKFQSVYSPSRLQFMLEHYCHPDFYCAFAWNVDIATPKLNCCTYFQAWGITRDLPWAPKMRQHHEATRKQFEMHPLSDQDRKLAMSYLPEDTPLSRL